MKRAALAVLVAAVVTAGCGGGAKHVHALGGGHVRHSLRNDTNAEIHAARRSDIELFRIFPARPAHKACAIPDGGMSAVKLRGSCRTSVTYPSEHGRYEEAFVRFRESWGIGHASSWTVIVQWPAEKVVATQLRGETSPQMRYAATDKTPGNQPALDAAASYAEKIAGAAHVFAGVVVDDPDNTVHLNLVHAPQSVIDELRARHPNTYVINNDAPRTWRAVTQLQKALKWKALAARGIDVVMSGPTQDGHLRVGVTSSVAKAQAYFDRKYGPNVIRVVHAEPAVAL
jgi:hypothetical protein